MQGSELTVLPWRKLFRGCLLFFLWLSLQAIMLFNIGIFLPLLIRQMTVSLAQIISISQSTYFATHDFHQLLFSSWQKPTVSILNTKFPSSSATHSSILAWRIPWTEELGGLQSTGSQRVRHNWVTSLSLGLPQGHNLKVLAMALLTPPPPPPPPTHQQ